MEEKLSSRLDNRHLQVTITLWFYQLWCWVAESKKKLLHYFLKHNHRYMAVNQIMTLSVLLPFNWTKVWRTPGQEYKFYKTILKRIATWNITTLYEAGKISIVLSEILMLGIQVLSLSVISWPNCGNNTKDNKSIFYSGKNTGTHSHGVGIIINKEIPPMNVWCYFNLKHNLKI